MTKKVEQIMSQMSDQEIRQRLAEYMEKDPMLHAPLVAVKVRLNSNVNANCRYEVLLIDAEGNETPVKFQDRYSRLIYIYTLLHPQGYQRRKPQANNYSALSHLYCQLYFRESNALLKTIASTDYEHFLSHYIAQSRKAVRQASPLAEAFTIDRPQAHNGKVLIPFVAEGGKVTIDASISNNKSFT
jgi:hypothetical protein